MKHVPEPWLKKLHIGYLVACVGMLLAYLLCKFVPFFQPYIGYIGDAPLPSFACLLTIFYSFVIMPRVRARNIWASYFIVYALMNVIFTLVVEVTGGYGSAFWFVWVVVAFFGLMLGLYAGLLTFILQLIGVGLIITGSFTNINTIQEVIISVSVSWSVLLAGFLFWRHYYQYDSDVQDAAAHLLKKEQIKTDFILGSMADGVLLIDPDGTIQYMNPAAALLTGWEQEEAIGLNYSSVLKFFDKNQKPYAEENNPLNLSVRQGKAIRDNNITYKTRSNKMLLLTVDAAPLLDDSGGKTGGIICIFRDVSQEKIEEQRRAEFISTASHEMRTPVAAIEGYLALAMNGKVCNIDNKARDFLEKAHSSTQHLGKLFQDLLTSAKAEDGRLASHPEVIEMGQYLERLTEDLRFTAEKKGLNMEFVMGSLENTIDATGGDKVIMPRYFTMADPDRLREVITNLFDNAVKYSESGKITIGLTGNDDVIQFFVRDTGPGIPPEDVPHLFQKFYRVDNSATRTVGGTGLGLFICRKIVALYNGRIWVESELEKGSTFFVNLPRIDARQAEAIAKSKPTAIKAT